MSHLNTLNIIRAWKDSEYRKDLYNKVEILPLKLYVLMCGFLMGVPEVTGAITFTRIIDVPGSTYTVAQGINNAGQIVGWFADDNTGPGGGAHGFLLDGGQFTVIDMPGAEGTYAYGINDAGQIVGDFRGPNQDGFDGLESFLYVDGSFTVIDPDLAPGIQTHVRDINNAGQIVGWTFDPVFLEGHSFLLDSGQFTVIDMPEPSAVPKGINDAGQIVGEFTEPAGIHGFLLDGGQFTVIDGPGVIPGAFNTRASGINDAGQIVGEFRDDTGVHGFLLDGGQFTVIDGPGVIPGAFYNQAYGINNAGQIAGAFQDATTAHGFVASLDLCRAQVQVKNFSARANLKLTSPTYTLRNLVYKFKASSLQGALSKFKFSDEETGKPFAAETRWEYKSQFKLDKNGLVDCRTKVTVKIKKEMPQWTNIRRRSAAVQAEWGRFLDVLGIHEQGHVDLIHQHFDGVLSKIVGKKPATAKAILEDINTELKRATNQYDDDTQHGETQGAKLDTTIQ
jgi:probable HAF family extracellular repeat protein